VGLFLFGAIFVIIGVLAGISVVGATAFTERSGAVAVAGQIFSLRS
jgi:hypothetical protein